jgi:F-type H+-transporting ATPase subunit delta
VRGKVVARNYAEALFELAQRTGQVEEYGGALAEVIRLIDEVPQLRVFLETPRIDRKEKRKVLREALSGKIPDPVLNFLFLVLDKRRQRMLDGIGQEYRNLLDDYLGQAHVEVSVARPMNEATLEKVRGELSRILGKKDVLAHVRVRPELLGGIVFRSGDVIYDGSVRRRMEQLKRRLLTADV